MSLQGRPVCLEEEVTSLDLRNSQLMQGRLLLFHPTREGERVTRQERDLLRKKTITTYKIVQCFSQETPWSLSHWGPKTLFVDVCSRAEDGESSTGHSFGECCWLCRLVCNRSRCLSCASQTFVHVKRWKLRYSQSYFEGVSQLLLKVPLILWTCSKLCRTMRD